MFGYLSWFGFDDKSNIRVDNYKFCAVEQFSQMLHGVVFELDCRVM